MLAAHSAIDEGESVSLSTAPRRAPICASMSRIDAPSSFSRPRRRLGWIAAIAAFGTLFGCAALPLPTRAAGISPPPNGKARIWIYSAWDPYGSQSQSVIRINGVRAGVFSPGYTFYRDVPPGEYRVWVESAEPFHRQFAPVAVVAGQQVYLKVEPWEDCSGGPATELCRTNFSTYLQPPGVGAAAVASLPLSGR